MIELELTYLAKSLPKNLLACRHKEIMDVYIPGTSDHPKLRLRKSGDKYELTKKEPVNQGDASHQEEQTIILTQEEFDALAKLDGKRVHKIRYYYDYQGRTAEFDVFQGGLEGLVVVEVEFPTLQEKDKFETPEFCLEDITQEDFIAGGKICGKTYEDIESELTRFSYEKLFLE